MCYQAWSLGAKELQIQTWGTSAEKMYGVGLDLAGIDNRVVVKLPITDAGIEAAALLKKQGVLVTMTGQHIYSVVVQESACLGCSAWRQGNSEPEEG